MLIANRSQYNTIIVMERDIQLNAIAQEFGREQIWSDELSQVDQDNREAESAMMGYPDEVVELTSHGHEDIDHEFLHPTCCDCETMDMEEIARYL